VGALPPALAIRRVGTGFVTNSFGINPRILPFAEQGPVFNGINFDVEMYSTLGQNTTVTAVYINVLVCPSEERPDFTHNVGGRMNVASYAYCEGDWFVWGGLDSTQFNRSTFGPNQSRRLASIRDGLSNTVWMSEARSYMPYYRDCTSDGSLTNFGPGKTYNANNVPPPDVDPFTVAPEYKSGTCAIRDGVAEGLHVEWVESSVNHTGFTTAWPPNKRIVGGPAGQYVDLDLSSRREKTGPTAGTFSAITARSYHPGGVNTLMGDGSVRFIKSTINGWTWRALGSVAGGEVISADQY
jgi:prepilin-type processing-associated H-X9-DG protein